MHTNSKPKTPTRQRPIYVGSRVVGHVHGKVFEKHIRGSIHLLRRPPAICFDVSTLTDAEQAGAESVAVTDVDSGKTYRATISEIWANGFRVSRGFGVQQAHALYCFRIDGAPEPTPSPQVEKAPEFIQGGLL